MMQQSNHDHIVRINGVLLDISMLVDEQESECAAEVKKKGINTNTSSSLYSYLLFKILLISAMSLCMTLMMASFHPTYGHTFSQNENSLFLTRMAQAHSQLNLIENLISNNTNTGNNNAKLVQTHIMQTIAFLNEKDPVNNFTWSQEIAEKNQRVSRDLNRQLNDLKISLSQDRPAVAINNNPSLSNSSSVIQDKIDKLGGLLQEAVSARVMKDAVNNSTNQALVLANLGNEIFYSYGQAIGFPHAKLANMVATMKMNANSRKAPVMAKNVNVVNESQYENAKGYIKQAQEIVSKYLKSSASNNKAASDIQLQLNKILSQLKMTIDNRGSFSTVMNLIHMQLHPRLIADYKIS
jgi:hypothetical protein